MAKKLRLLLVCVFLFHAYSYTQLFSESVTIFGITFKATEVAGQKRFIGNTDYYRTSILNPLIIERNENYFYTLGSYRRDKDKMETLDLFNMSVQNNTYPFLDSIDNDYYRSFGFSYLERQYPNISNDGNYKHIKSCYTDSLYLSVAERKKRLFAMPDSIKNYIFFSRYSLVKNQFNIDKKKVTKATAELKAQLDTITISNDANLTAKVRIYLSRLADESTKMNGYYLDISLHKAYIDKINFYVNNASKISIGNDQFAFNLKNYVLSGKAAANTGLLAIMLDGSIDKTRISADSISIDLGSQFHIPADDAKRIAASIAFAFTRQEKVTFKNTFNNTFIIRYTTSSIIDDMTFLQGKFTYSDGVEDGRNMASIVKKLEDYYGENARFPVSLNELKAETILNYLGQSRLSYIRNSDDSLILRFAGGDLALNTSDDKVYEGRSGSIKRIQ